jgi:hypothetical protein
MLSKVTHLTTGAILSATAVGTALTWTQTGQAGNSPFICAVDQKGVPSTYYNSSQGPIPVFKWQNTSFPPPYTPMRRCQEVTQRLNNYKAQGMKLKNFQSGRLNGENVVCLGSCASNGSNLLFTLIRGQNPRQVLQALTASSRGASGPVFQSSCPSTSLIDEGSDGTVTFDLDNYLCRTQPEDMSTISSPSADSASETAPSPSNPADDSNGAWEGWGF